MTPPNEPENLGETPVAPSGEENQKKAAKKKRKEAQLPFLVDVVFQFSGFFLFLISAIVALVSYLSGAQFLQIFLRTVITIVVFGVLLLWLSSVVSQGMFEAALQEFKSQGANMAESNGSDNGVVRQDIKA